MTEKRPDVYRATTPEALAEARGIVAAARIGALGTLMPGGHPMATRVAVASLDEGRTPLLFVSSLSAHTPQLRADPRCSLLVGGVVKGDPLASPRVTLTCTAREVARGSEDHVAMREVWLAAHPKAKVYIDLTDFVFIRLAVEAVTFVGGFGRAFAISGEEWAG